MTVIETSRLRLRHVRPDDAELVLELLNEPAWLRFIGDKGVRTLDDAREYIEKGPMESYERFGFGTYVVELAASGTPVGISGLIQRETLEDVDLGFAFLERFWGHGYAREAAAGVLELAQSAFGLERIVAIADPKNSRSLRVLESVGFTFERTLTLGDDHTELALYAWYARET